MATDRAEGNSISLSEAIKVKNLDSHTYRVDLSDKFCIGAVPNGGYTAACLLAAATAHLSSLGQPDTLTAHFEYPNRTSTGPAVIVVEEVKLGRQLSTLHLTLWQGGLLSQAPWITLSVSRRTVLAYATQTNLRTLTGITLPTGYKVTPAAAPLPLPDFEALKTEDGLANGWEEAVLPESLGFARSMRNWHFYLPRDGPLTPGVLDVWIRTASGERITQSALAYVADSFPHPVLSFLVAPELHKRWKAPEHQARKQGSRDEQPTDVWFPTVVMDLEMKMALPDEGVEWLAVRVTSKQIKDGRLDIDVCVRDVEGELVLLGHQVALIISMERNLGKKGSPTKVVL